MSSPTSAPEVQGCHGPALALRTGTGGREGRRCPLSAAEPESGPSGSGHTRSSCTRLRRARRSTVASDPGGCGWSLSPGLRSSAETSPGDPRSSPAVRATDRGQGRARPRGAAEACRALAAAPRSPAPGSADLFLLPWKLPRQAQPAGPDSARGEGGSVSQWTLLAVQAWGSLRGGSPVAGLPNSRQTPRPRRRQSSSFPPPRSSPRAHQPWCWHPWGPRGQAAPCCPPRLARPDGEHPRECAAEGPRPRLDLALQGPWQALCPRGLGTGG